MNYLKLPCLYILLLTVMSPHSLWATDPVPPFKCVGYLGTKVLASSKVEYYTVNTPNELYGTKMRLSLPGEDGFIHWLEIKHYTKTGNKYSVSGSETTQGTMAPWRFIMATLNFDPIGYLSEVRNGRLELRQGFVGFHAERHHWSFDIPVKCELAQ